jgi:hypothetical protein
VNARVNVHERIKQVQHDSDDCCILCPPETSFRQSVRLQGGVKFPTGGMQTVSCNLERQVHTSLQARERSRERVFKAVRSTCEVSRSGERPEPTVRVRMEEDVQIVICSSIGVPPV